MYLCIQNEFKQANISSFNFAPNEQNFVWNLKKYPQHTELCNLAE